jgi:hypothetical protein
MSPQPTQDQTPIGSFLPAGLRDLALKALVASATAIGFTGFVAVLGGAILWVRFYSARLPADQALAVMPKGELVIFGAVTLVTFFILGGLTVLASYLLDPRAGPTASTRRILITLVARTRTSIARSGSCAPPRRRARSSTTSGSTWMAMTVFS